MRSRYYDPSTGRFTQRDKYLGNYTDPLSLNRYTYGHNNPIKYIDPSGYVVTEWDLKNCTPTQIAQIKAATDAWNNATTQAEKDAAHAAANAARSGNLSAGQYVSSEGYVRESNGTAATGGSTNVYVGTVGSSATKSNTGVTTNAKTGSSSVLSQAESNIESAYNAWQGGYITFAQYIDNAALNLGGSIKSTGQINTNTRGLANIMLFNQALLCMQYPPANPTSLEGYDISQSIKEGNPNNVLLRYIAEKNGGTINVVEEDIGIFGIQIMRVAYVEVTIGDISIKYKGRIVNGKMIIDSRQFGRDFNITDNALLTHQYNSDRFNTPGDAALAWALTYYPKSNQTGNPREYGSNILTDSGGYYFDDPAIGQVNRVIIPAPAAGETRAAFIHSHPFDINYKYNEFSSQDLQTMRNANIPSYLVSPNGKIQVAYVNEKSYTKTETVFSGIYYTK